MTAQPGEKTGIRDPRRRDRYCLRTPVSLTRLCLTADSSNNEEITDILFVITYSGRVPEWPA